MFNKFNWLIIISYVFLFHPIATLAGWADGPYVVWVNFDTKNPDKVNLTAKYLFNEHDSCIDYTRSPIFYMKKRPAKITNALVYNALIKKSASAQNALHNSLVEFTDKSIWDSEQTIQGLDGIIAYLPLPKPRLVSFTFNKYTYKNKIKIKYIENLDDKKSFRDALCEVMPEITRD
jgi:hypothetical protein